MTLRPFRIVLVVLVGLGFVPSAVSAAPRPSAVGAGFTDEPVGTVSSATAIETLPDGTVVVLNQDGAIRLIRNGALLATPAATLTVCSNGERGLLGFTHGPDFLNDRQVFIYYTTNVGGSGCVNRVSRFTMTGDTVDLASERVLVDAISSAGSNHNGGDVDIGADGFLYISIGDAGSPPRGPSPPVHASQDLSLLNGKILRVDPVTGFGAPGNPLSGAGTADCRVRGNTASTPTTTCREIYAWGLRNPFRFAFDPNTGPHQFFINDVGQVTREEVDRGALGADYGWPTREGVCPRGAIPPCDAAPPGVTDPITDYGRSYGSFVTAGAFVPNGHWPKAFDGGYLFGDGGSGKIWLRSANGAVDYDAPFATGLFDIVDMAFVDHDGEMMLYYARAGGTIGRIRANPVAAVPTGPLAFQAVPPGTRVLDTRMPAFGDKLVRAGETRMVPMPVPSANVRAALVNIVTVNPRSPGFITAWASRTKRPPISNLNAFSGEVAANAAIVPLDADGNLEIYSLATTDVVIDLLGWFVAAPNAVRAGRFTPLPPHRIAETRAAVTADNQFTRGAGAELPFVRVPVSGRGGIPNSGVSSAVLMVTAISTGGPTGGFVSATPGGSPFSGSSNLNTNGLGDVRPNLVVVPIGPDGTVDLHLLNIADVAVDVAGWFTDATQPESTTGRFNSVALRREVDTRINLPFGRFPGNESRSIAPVDATPNGIAVAQNITIVDNQAALFVTPYPGGVLPLVSAGNATAAGQVRAVLSFTALSAPPARIFYYTLAATHLVVDTLGYFEP